MESHFLLLILFLAMSTHLFALSEMGVKVVCCCIFPILVIALTLLLKNFLLVTFVLPSLVLSKLFKKTLAKCKAKALLSNGWFPLLLKTNDGILLDSVQWSCPLQDEPKKQRWIIWLNSGEICYEDVMSTVAHDFAAHIGANVILFNYRGVGLSSGPWPSVAADLVEDARTALRFVMATGAKEENVLVYGKSLGAALGSLARGDYPSGPFVSECSFSSSGSLIHHWLENSSSSSDNVCNCIGLLFATSLYLARICTSDVAAIVLFPQFVVIFSVSLLVLYCAVHKFSASTRQIQFILLTFLVVESSKVFSRSTAPINVIFTPKASIIGAVTSNFLEFSDTACFSRFYAFFQHFLVGITLGCIIRCLNLHGNYSISSTLLAWIGWDIDQVQAWNKIKGQKLCVFQEHDKYSPSSVSLKAALTSSGVQIDSLHFSNVDEHLASDSRFCGTMCKFQYCFNSVNNSRQSLNKIETLFPAY